MTVKLASLKIDLQKEAEGERIESVRYPGVSYLLKSLNDPGYQTDRSLLMQKLARKYGRKPVPQTVLVPEIGKLFAKRIVLGWDGFDVEYSEDVAIETLSDIAYREVVADIEDCASQVAATQIEFVEELEKN